MLDIEVKVFGGILKFSLSHNWLQPIPTPTKETPLTPHSQSFTAPGLNGRNIGKLFKHLKYPPPPTKSQTSLQKNKKKKIPNNVSVNHEQSLLCRPQYPAPPKSTDGKPLAFRSDPRTPDLHCPDPIGKSKFRFVFHLLLHRIADLRVEFGCELVEISNPSASGSRFGRVLKEWRR